MAGEDTAAGESRAVQTAIGDESAEECCWMFFAKRCRTTPWVLVYSVDDCFQALCSLVAGSCTSAPFYYAWIRLCVAVHVSDEQDRRHAHVLPLCVQLPAGQLLCTRELSQRW